MADDDRLLSILKIGVTYRCNTHCVHCGVSGRIRRDEPELSLEEIERLAVESRLAGAEAIVLFGGEPTVRADLLDMIRVIHRHVPEVLMDSNGLRIDSEFAAALADAGLARVDISLHGPDAETHRAISGRDTFQQVMDAVRASVASPIETHVSVVVTRESMADGSLARMVEMCRQLGVDGVRMLLPKVSGEWSDDPAVLLSDEEQDRLGELVDGDFAYVEGPGQAHCSCGAVFEGRFYVSPYGLVQPCHFIPVGVGSVRREPLYDLVRRSRSDVPWMPRAFFSERGCPVTHPEAMELFGGKFLHVGRDNVVDLGGGLDDDRPAVPLDRLRTSLTQIAQAGHHHVYLVGGDPLARRDAASLMEILHSEGLGATVVCDPRVFRDPAPDWLDRAPILRVVAPVGAPLLPLDDENLVALSEAVVALRARGLPIDLVLLDRISPERLRALLAVSPGQVSALALRRRPGEAPEDEPRTAILDLFPGLDDRGARTLVAFGGLSVGRAADGPSDRVSYEAMRDIDGAVTDLLASDSQTLRLSLDVAGLAEALPAVRRALPSLREAGRRLLLRRVGQAESDADGQRAHHQELLSPSGRASVGRLLALRDAAPDVLSVWGFGPALFRPWTDLASLRGLALHEPWMKSSEAPLWDAMLREAILHDVDPPSLAGMSDRDAWPARRTSWTLRDPEAATARAQLLSVALQLDGAERPEGLDEATWEAVERALAASDSGARRLGALFESIRSGTLIASRAPGESAVERALSDGERLIVEADEELRALVEGLMARPEGALSGWAVEAVERAVTDEAVGIRMTLEGADRSLIAVLIPAESTAAGLYRGDFVTLMHAGDTPPQGRAESAALRDIGALLDAYLARVAAGDGDVEATLADFEMSVSLPDTTGRTPLGEALAQQVELIRRVAERIGAAPRSPLPGWALASLTSDDGVDGFCVTVELERRGERLALSLFPADAPGPAFVSGERVKLRLAPDQRFPRGVGERALSAVCHLMNHYLKRAASASARGGRG